MLPVTLYSGQSFGAVPFCIFDEAVCAKSVVRAWRRLA